MWPRHFGRSVQAVAAFAVLAPLAAVAQTADSHKIIAHQEITWGPGPASLPAGAQAVTLYGDASKEGLFAMRFKLPKGYQIPPHTHSKPEVVTVMAGTVRLGMGETADPEKATQLPAGSFFALSPGMAHFVISDEESIV